MEPLNHETQTLLREANRIHATEVAYAAGDLVVVIDVTTDARRVLCKLNEVLNENKRRLIKG